ncbi:hypothetical protein MMC26_000237 [Xylographa opegraphella]|nr:hypothetical protein [Xylographa opegraphella]
MFSTTSSPLRRRGGGNGVSQIVPLKGLFADGIWQCNCSPRLPAEHFQTKNGGRNHGRWFYTCQKPQPSRCGFFLWADEARHREAGAVLLNARSEAVARGTASVQPVVPYTPSKPPRTNMAPVPATGSPPEEFYDWPASDDDDDDKNNKISPSPSDKRVPPQSSPSPAPRKALKTDAFSTPTKRSHGEMAFPTPSTTGKAVPTTSGATFAAAADDVFTTPTTAPLGRTLFSTATTTTLPSPATTPTPQRFRAPPEAGPSSLEAEILDALGESAVGADGRAKLRAVCKRWEMHLRGVERGREVVRMAVRAKEARIAELVGRLEGLEREREAGRALVRSLRGGGGGEEGG